MHPLSKFYGLVNQENKEVYVHVSNKALFNTQSDLPFDVLGIIFQSLTFSEFYALSRLNKAWRYNFNKFVHLCDLKKELIPIIDLLSIYIPPALPDNPFSSFSLTRLEALPNFKTKFKYVQVWLAEVYLWAKEVNNTSLAVLLQSKLLHLRTVHNSMIADALYCSVAQLKPMDTFSKFSKIKEMDHHPCMRKVSFEHCKRVLTHLEFENPTESNCLELSKFIRRTPLKEFIDQGTIDLSDVKSPFVKLEIMRILQDSSRFIDPTIYFNQLSSEGQKQAIMNHAVNHHIQEPSNYLEGLLESYQESDMDLFSEAMQQTSSTIIYTSCNSSSPKIKLLTTGIAVALLILAAYQFIRLAAEGDSKHLVYRIVIATPSLVSAITLITFRLIVNHFQNDYTRKKELFLV